MKAVIYTQYGSPEMLHPAEVATPTPKENQVRIRIHATTVTIGDTRMRSFTVPRAQWLFARLYLGIRKPRRSILGMEFAGVIDTVGPAVTHYHPGDQVFGSTFAVGFGGYAEYICLPEDGILTIKPTSLTFEEAAALPGGGMTALRCLRKAHIQPWQRVLIYGASGAVGTNAVQIARHFGARVTGVCSTKNINLVHSIGANTVLDYTRGELARHEEHYDVVFDAVSKLPVAQGKRLLNKTGIYLDVHTASSGREKIEDLEHLKQLVENGALKPVIDQCYPLDQIVEAHRYVEQGHKRGNVAITIVASDQPSDQPSD